MYPIIFELQLLEDVQKHAMPFKYFYPIEFQVKQAAQVQNFILTSYPIILARLYMLATSYWVYIRTQIDLTPVKNIFDPRFSNVFFRYYGYYECQIVFGYDRCMMCHVAYFM